MTDDIPNELFRPERAAQYLDCSRSTVYELMETGQLRSLKINKLRRIPRAELDRYIREQMGATTEPVASSAIPEVA